MDNSAGIAQDADLFVSLVHFLNSRHTCFVVGLIIGLNSVIIKIHEDCIKIKVLKLHLIQYFALHIKSRSLLSNEQASENYNKAVLRVTFWLFAVLSDFNNVIYSYY